MFMNELELLELRLMTLYDVVDYFILIEAGNTHSSIPKPFYFDENKEMFKKYLDKIIYLKIDKLPYLDSWKNENYNRERLIDGIVDANYDDYIMVSDIDEIPNPIVLKQGINNNLDFFILQQKLFYYYVNCIQVQLWSGPVIMKRKKPYYILIDLYNLQNSIICNSIMEIANITGIHRNTITAAKTQIRSHFMIIPYKL
jgi:hypothetical protein